VAGVVVELVVIISEYTKNWRDFKRGTIHSSEKPSVLIFGLGFLGAGLVAIGVAGEFQIHTKAGKIETDMRDTTRKLVSIVEGEAGKANERARKAKERAQKLENENLKLRERLAPRHLMPEHQRLVANRLRRFSGQRVNMFSYAGDDEVAGITRDIRSALSGKHGAGWIITSATGQELDRAGLGVIVEIAPEVAAALSVPTNIPNTERDEARKVQKVAEDLVKVLCSVSIDVQGPTPGPVGNRTPSFSSLSRQAFKGDEDPKAKIKITIARPRIVQHRPVFHESSSAFLSQVPGRRLPCRLR
jgi:hypothetical protein